MNEKCLKNVQALAELIGVENPQFRDSCYNGIEIYWIENKDGKEIGRIVTFVDTSRKESFAYTKNIEGLSGDWQKVDYYFLYI